MKFDKVEIFCITCIFFAFGLVTFSSVYSIGTLNGWSMCPTICNGSTVLVQTWGFDIYNIPNGTVIVYKATSTPEPVLIEHRIIQVLHGSYILKGDNNTSPDPYPVYPDQIVGIYVCVLW